MVGVEVPALETQAVLLVVVLRHERGAAGWRTGMANWPCVRSNCFCLYM